MEKKKRIVSGITATGSLTIGNYLGAIKNFVELQKDNELFIFVADLHAITIDISKEELIKNKRDIFALYLASGLNPEKTTIFFQSHNHNHLLFNWITTCNSNIGELQRMTQFKDKIQKIEIEANGTQRIPTGLFLYPTLMVADILLYNPDLIPVGIDQKQHIELTEKIAIRLNNKYNLSLKTPKAYFSKIGTKIMSLKNPEKKMSKSDSDKNASIFLLDDPELAYKKIQKAVTDNENKIYIAEHKKGILNLLTIYSSLNNISLEEAAEKFKNNTYKEFKNEVGDSVKEFLVSIQEKYHFYINQVDEISQKGSTKAIIESNKFIKEIYEKVGL
ncbi:MAG: tryptophan--tRNA ligase [Metamycoplasmataceae bacterium]